MFYILIYLDNILATESLNEPSRNDGLVEEK